MASYTTNLNLKKPAGSENVAIGDINNNMDAIDAAYGTLNSKIALSSALATSSYGSVRYNMFGKVVVVCGDMNFTSSLSAGSTIATGLPVPYYLQPTTYSQNGYMGLIISFNNGISFFQIDKDGKIIADSATPTSYCRLFITYLAE